MGKCLINLYINKGINLTKQDIDYLLKENWKVNERYQDYGDLEICTYVDANGNRYLDIASNIIPDEEDNVTNLGEIVLYEDKLEVEEYVYVKDLKSFLEVLDDENRLKMFEEAIEFLKTAVPEELEIILDYYHNLKLKDWMED